MQFKTGSPADAERDQRAVFKLSGPFYAVPNRAGAEAFEASISVSAVREYMQASNLSCLIARFHLGTLAGFIAMRDQTRQADPGVQSSTVELRSSTPVQVSEDTL